MGVLLWIRCQKLTAAVKRSQPTSSEAGASGDLEIPKTKRAGPGYSAHMKKMHEEEEILETLKRKHEENFTPEQLCTWAHMIQMKKHSSYDTAPNKPIFRSKSKKTTAATIADIPVKVVRVHLDKWYNLKQKGAISDAQYEELQALILGDIKKLLINNLECELNPNIEEH